MANKLTKKKVRLTCQAGKLSVPYGVGAGYAPDGNLFTREDGLMEATKTKVKDNRRYRKVKGEWKMVGKVKVTTIQNRTLEDMDLLAFVKKMGGDRVPTKVLDAEVPGWQSAAVRLEAKKKIKVRREGVCDNQTVSLYREPVYRNGHCS